MGYYTVLFSMTTLYAFPYVLKRCCKMKSETKIYSVLINTVVVALLLTITIPHICLAVITGEQLKIWPFPCYQGEELRKVREWEKTWAGKKINQDNIDQVKEFLSEQYYQVYKNPREWGADELWFTILPYKQVLPTPGQIDATKRYAPGARLDPNTRKAYWKEGIGPNEFLVGWDKGDTAGFPFPFPKSGLEIAWNLEAVTRGDTKSYRRESVIINPKTGVERQIVEISIIDYYTGRVDVPPIPQKPKNSKGIRRGSNLTIEEPLDVQGLMYMELGYLNVEKPEDIWSWIPMFRRIRRLGIVWKEDTMHGRDMFPDDENGWNNHVNIKNWKLVGRKEMLLGRHTDASEYTRKKGQIVWSGQQLERINTYVLEAKFKDSKGAYSKEILYIDPEMWRCLQKVAWDREGKVWRQFFYHTEIIKSTQGIVQPHCIEMHSMDMQKKRGSPSKNKVKEIGQQIPNSFWTIQNLQKTGY
jgi:hypothetical protein